MASSLTPGPLPAHSHRHPTRSERGTRLCVSDLGRRRTRPGPSDRRVRSARIAGSSRQDPDRVAHGIPPLAGFDPSTRSVARSGATHGSRVAGENSWLGVQNEKREPRPTLRNTDHDRQSNKPAQPSPQASAPSHRTGCGDHLQLLLC